jgi:hypothetical protein
MRSRFRRVLIATVAVCAPMVIVAAGASAAGPSWTGQEPPLPKGAKVGQNELRDVSCTSSTSCIAVGGFRNSAGVVNVPLADSWNGTEWTTQELPLPAGAKHGSLKAVSCTSSTACIAVGQALNSAEATVPLVERWNGASWTPSEILADVTLEAVSCTSSTSCIAVGSNVNFEGKVVPVTENWNGTAWTWKNPPAPKSSMASHLDGISCTSSTSCIAAGGFENTSKKKLPLAESWNGTAWAVQEPASPTGAESSELSGVSCASSSACIAAGGFENNLGKNVPLAESWNGTAWTVQEPPSPTGAKSSYLTGVSCTSSTTCMAVGHFENSAGKIVPLAESWNGTAWTVQEPPLPAEGLAGTLYGISCVSATTCMASGWFGKSGSVLPLAEYYH